MIYAFLKFFLPIIILLITYWLQFRIDHGNKSEKNKRINAKYLYFLSACLLMLTAIFQFQDWKDANESSNSLEAKYLSLQKEYVTQSQSIGKKVESVVDSMKLISGKENNLMKDRLSILQDSVGVQNAKVFSLYDDINQKSNFIQNTLFGEGYAFVTRGPSAVDSIVSVSFLINNFSEYPIYNFSMKIFNYNELKKRANKYFLPSRLVLSATDYQNCILYTIGPMDLNPNELFQTNFTEEKYYEHAVAVINTRNGIYYEKLLFWPDTDINKWLYYAYELYDNELNLIASEVPEYIWPYEDTLQLMLNKIDLKFFKTLKVTNEDEWW